MSRHSSYSRTLSFLLSLVLILTLADPAAKAQGLSGDEYIPVTDVIT